MTNTLRYDTATSPAGVALAVVDEGGTLVRLTFGNGTSSELRRLERAGAMPDRDPCANVFGQLAEYFAGERRTFDLPIRLEGLGFERRVWDQLLEIPYGSTLSYGEVARRLGGADGARAVGRAAHANPIPIVVPCHRLIGSDGSLVGFGLGLAMKQRLLDLERSVIGDAFSFLGALNTP
jgi:methylated-DNA-[protein]-cysteine S-methyltransferase